MPRCIVLIRSHQVLQESWHKRSFGPAGSLLEDRVKIQGVRFDETYHPVQVLRRIGGGDDPPAASGFKYSGIGPAATYAVRVEGDDDVVERLRRDRHPEIVGVFADPAVSPFPSAYCGEAAVGATDDVARALGVPALRRRGLTGGGVHVAVVDTGIDGSRIPVAGGWAPTPGYVPGSTAPTHGTMVAYDVRIAAPDAQILDYALLKSQAGTWAAFLSDAIAAFADLVERVNGAPGRWVVNNSWGLFDRASDAPIGSPENYSANPDHPFNQITGSLVAAGAGAAQGPVAADRPRPGGRRLGLRLGLRSDRRGGGAEGAGGGGGTGGQAAGQEASETGGVARPTAASLRTPGSRRRRSVRRESAQPAGARRARLHPAPRSDPAWD